MGVFCRIPLEEILNSPLSSTVPRYQEALDAGTFEFGVDKTELGFRLTINGRIIGVYLHPEPHAFREQIDSPYEAVIAPNQEYAGTIVHNEKKSIIIYVNLEEYRQFCRDAQFVYDLYSSDDLCFRSIPDVWFSDLALVRFIRECLHPSPVMSGWFGPSVYSFKGSWLGPKFVR